MQKKTLKPSVLNKVYHYAHSEKERVKIGSDFNSLRSNSW